MQAGNELTQPVRPRTVGDELPVQPLAEAEVNELLVLPRRAGAPDRVGGLVQLPHALGRALTPDALGDRP